MNILNFEKLITETFQSINITPREGQVEAIDKILTAFFINGNKRVVLNAPTGYGKSIIAIVVSKTMQKIKMDQSLWHEESFAYCNEGDEGFKSCILMHTNVLVDQYEKSFKGIPGFYSIRGAEHYQCPHLGQTADHCYKFALTKAIEKAKGPDKDSLIKQLDYCTSECEYKISRKLGRESEILCTNNSYHILMQIYARPQSSYPDLIYPMRNLCVVDEAHLLNDSFVSHMQIHLTKDILRNIYKDLDKQGLQAPLCTDLIKEYDDISETEYKDYFKRLCAYYKTAALICAKKSEEYLKDDKKKEYARCKSLYNKYFGLHCKIDDLFKYDYEHIVDIGDEQIDIKPIFMRDLFRMVITSEYQLFMSATIEPTLMKYFYGTSKFEYIQLKPIFDKSQKKVTFFNIGKLNHSNIQESSKELAMCCEEIMRTQEGKGIIMTPSFAISSSISDYLRTKKKFKKKIFEHKKGEKITVVLDDHRGYEGPSLIITPSGFEGIDLKDDESRFQIMVKAPYYSLGDKRMKYILDKYPKLYSLITLYKIVQGMGRSTRNQSDHSHTYCLDSNICKLFMSQSNIWIDEFEYEIER